VVTQLLGSDRAGTAFARAMGGEIVQTTPRFSADPAALRGWADAQPVPPGVVVGDLTTAPAAELVDAHRDLYRWAHEDWCPPPMWLPGVTGHAEATVAALRREVSSGARVDGRLAAFAFVVAEPDGLLLISETVRRSEPDGTALVAAVVADALRRLAAAGVPAVELDGHHTDPHLDPVTRTFPPGLRTDPLYVVRFAPRPPS
jgi:hypothetical protein